MVEMLAPVSLNERPISPKEDLPVEDRPPLWVIAVFAVFGVALFVFMAGIGAI